MIKKRMILIITISISSILIAFFNIYTVYINDFRSEVDGIKNQVERYVEISDSLSQLITMYGNDFFLQDESVDSVFYPYLQYDEQTNSYHLDGIERNEHIEGMGNITGYGEIPTHGRVKDEINLAFQLFQLFQSVREVLPDEAWLYYVSNEEFLALYPWISSEEFAYSDKIKTNSYFSWMLPEVNPNRESGWIPLYQDNAGKGLIVTLTSPIYDGDLFKGVVCIDLTSRNLSNLLQSSFKGYLIDEIGNIVASSQEEQSEEIIGISSVLSYSRGDWERIASHIDNKLSVINGEFVIYLSVHNAPWNLIYQVPIWQIVIQSMIYIFPVIVIFLLLIFASIQTIKQKRAEILLQNSLEELTSYQVILENAAHYDSLTKVYNRRGLQFILDDKIKENKNFFTPMSFLICDIDHFKKINDTYGHAAGDKILIELTKYIKNSVKEQDAVCRWGGEEFVIFLYHCAYQNAIKNAEKLRKGVEELEITWEGSKIPFTMTFGVVEYNYSDSLEEMIEKADRALYKGKEAGRNCVVGFINGELIQYK